MNYNTLCSIYARIFSTLDDQRVLSHLCLAREIVFVLQKNPNCQRDIPILVHIMIWTNFKWDEYTYGIY